MSATANDPVEGSVETPSVEECKALIERVAASSHFTKATRLRAFLLYVGRQSLKDGKRDIHEHEIGLKVFERNAETYDRGQDNIVRVNATELRKRIDLYFSSEGIIEPLVFEIPRGGYKPVFRRRVIPDEIPSPEIAEAVKIQERLSNSQESEAATVLPMAHEPAGKTLTLALWQVYLAWTMILVLAVLCVSLCFYVRTIEKTSHPEANRPALKAFWAEIYKNSRQTDIVLPDASVSLSEEILGKPIPLREYANHDYMGQIQGLGLSEDRKQDLGVLFAHSLIAFGDFQAGEVILDVAPSSSSSHLTISRSYDAESMKNDNLILIGGKKANPWVRLFDNEMNFSLDYDPTHSQLVIVDRHPKDREQAVYARPVNDPNSVVGFSVIAFLPNPSHTGSLIIIEGTDSDATRAAAGFLTSEEQLERLSQILHLKKLPYFELLLKTSKISDTGLNSQIIASRAYPDLR